MTHDRRELTPAERMAYEVGFQRGYGSGSRSVHTRRRQARIFRDGEEIVLIEEETHIEERN